VLLFELMLIKHCECSTFHYSSSLCIAELYICNVQTTITEKLKLNLSSPSKKCLHNYDYYINSNIKTLHSVIAISDMAQNTNPHRWHQTIEKMYRQTQTKW